MTPDILEVIVAAVMRPRPASRQVKTRDTIWSRRAPQPDLRHYTKHLIDGGVSPEGYFRRSRH